LITRNVGTSADSSTRKLNLFGDNVEGRRSRWASEPRARGGRGCH